MRGRRRDRRTVAAAPVGSHPAAGGDGPDRPPWLLSALFQATIEAAEEAVVNALFAATTVVGRDGNTLFAMPPESALAAVRAAGRLSR